MRRGLAVLSLLLILIGLELSTEAVSLVVSRVEAGVTALRSGVGFQVGAPRFLIGLGMVTVGFGIWMLFIWSARVRRAVTAAGRLCPQCGGETRRVKRRKWHRLLAVLLGHRITRRKCEVCGWVGLSHRT
ncbi:MAG: hypothetical protein ACE5GJ_06005 [Gemmatimonadota bacterium]